MKKIYFVIAAVAMMMAGCEKQAENENTVNSMNSFDLNIQGFSDASGAKTHWDDAGLWWNEDGSDYLVINGVSFQVIKDSDDKWKAISTDGVGPDNGNFYVAYPYTDGAGYSNHSYGSVEFDGTTIPLAAVTTSNSITLNPCCAVIKVSYTVEDPGSATVEFIDENGDPVDVEVFGEGNIDIENHCISDGSTVNVIETYDAAGNGSYYLIIPMGRDGVTSYLRFNYSENDVTTRAVHLENGVIYDVKLSGE